MKPRSKGTVRLNDSDPRDAARDRPGLLSEPQDAEVLAEGFEALRGLAASEPVRRYAATEIRPGEPT